MKFPKNNSGPNMIGLLDFNNKYKIKKNYLENKLTQVKFNYLGLKQLALKFNIFP